MEPTDASDGLGKGFRGNAQSRVLVFDDDFRCLTVIGAGQGASNIVKEDRAEHHVDFDWRQKRGRRRAVVPLVGEPDAFEVLLVVAKVRVGVERVAARRHCSQPLIKRNGPASVKRIRKLRNALTQSVSQSSHLTDLSGAVRPRAIGVFGHEPPAGLIEADLPCDCQSRQGAGCDEFPVQRHRCFV